MRHFFVIIMYLFSASVHAELLDSNPSKVCSLMSGFGLRTHGWKNIYGEDYSCSSPYKELGSSSPLPNNLAFYAEGSSNSARQVKLVLNIYVRASSSSAHAKLLEAAEEMSLKATGIKLPESVRNAINGGTETSKKVGSALVSVSRENWPENRGYEVKVIIR